MKRKLPIGIQTFREIREDGHYYVDKTEHIGRLIDLGKYYFLSRPRRFGKSLLVDTIKELFEGSEALFRGLHIHDGWDWSEITMRAQGLVAGQTAAPRNRVVCPPAPLARWTWMP